MSEFSDWASLCWSSDASGRERTVVRPCFQIVVYVFLTEREQLAEFYAAAMTQLEGHLTHYQALDKDEAKISPRALGMVPTWLRKPREFYWYNMDMWGGGTDYGPYGFHALFCEHDVPPVGPRVPSRGIAGSRASREGYPLSIFRLSLPVDHELTRPASLIRYLSSVSLLRNGFFVSANCGYALRFDDRWSQGDEKRIESLCARYSGLDFVVHTQSGFLLGVRPEVPWIVPLIRRPSWMTLVNELAVEYLGGLPTVSSKLQAPGIELHPIGTSLLIQAGPRPELGDITRGEKLPLLSHVARVLAPIRPERLTKDDSPFWNHFLNIFDDA
ncbi:MAG: hypothetical protein RLZZ450_3753 [Pseudomonadota bacterium]|jgi:hypothetical protein